MSWRHLIEAPWIVFVVYWAIGALKTIADLQGDLYEQQRTSQGGQNRQWAFELRVGEETVRKALTDDIGDPALIEHLVAVQAWAADTRTVLPLPAKDALFQLQYSTQAREAAEASLRRMMPGFLDGSSGRSLPKSNSPR